MIDNERLRAMSDLDDWEFVNRDQDIRGFPLTTRSGRRLGIIRRMLVDREHERVAAVVLDDGRAIPIEDVEIKGGTALIDDIEEKTLATAPMAPPRQETGDREEHIPIVEEEVAIGKRMVERGHVRVRTRVVERPVDEDVTLREERVTIERRPVGTPVAEGERLLSERDVEIVERGEEPVVEKRARVTEEVVVHKDVREHKEHIHDTVRHTEVDVEDDREKQRLAAKSDRDRMK